MKEEISPDLIQKYLNGQCTPEEIARIHAWYDSFEGDPDPLVALSAAQRQELKRRMFGRVLAGLPTRDDAPQIRRIIAWRPLFYALSGVAAVFLLLVGLNWLNRPKGGPAVTVQPETVQEYLAENKTRTIQKQLLPDGSVVWLQPQTTLRYPAVFKADRRQVSLVGEAFFDVHKDSAHPFVIHSDRLITTVLGTSFRIRAYPKDPSIQVSVITGKVSVQLTPENTTEDASEKTVREVLLLPDQKAEFMRRDQVLRKEEATRSELRIWRKNSISFDNVPVREVVKRLNAVFGVAIRVETRELNELLLTADFTDQNLPDVLEMLQRSLNATYEVNGREIMLKPH